MTDEQVDWDILSARASMASHRLIGWIYWDPYAIERYMALGMPEGPLSYLVTRGAPLAPAGHQALAAAYYSIAPFAVEMALAVAASCGGAQALADARDEAVGRGLREYVPEICDGLAALAGPLWEAADALPLSGRVLFAAHRHRARPQDALISAWLAVNCIREWRGDTHFALLTTYDISATQAGILHDAFLNYSEDDWIARSRGSDDAALEAARADFQHRGLITDGRVNEAGLALRQDLEDRTDRLTQRAWRLLGRERTSELLELVEPVGDQLLQRIDQTAGPDWMPAARPRRG